MVRGEVAMRSAFGREKSLLKKEGACGLELVFGGVVTRGRTNDVAGRSRVEGCGK